MTVFKDFEELMEEFSNPDMYVANNEKKARFMEFYIGFSEIFTKFNTFQIESYGELAEGDEQELYRDVLIKMNKLNNAMKNVMAFYNGDFDIDVKRRDTAEVLIPNSPTGRQDDSDMSSGSEF